jgi:hypothetical protein
MRKNRNLLFAIVMSLVLQILPNSNAAVSVVYNGLLDTCHIVFSSNNIFVNRLVSRTTTNITGINVRVGTGLNSNWTTTTYSIFSNHPTNNKPGEPLATFTSDSTTGTGLSTIVHFTGSYTITSGMKFYVIPSVSAATFPVCYTNSPPTADLIPNLGINVDTSTSNTNANWNKVYIGASTPPTNSPLWTINDYAPQIWEISLESSPPSTQVNVTISSASGSIAIFRKTNVLSASVDTPSKVTFYQGSKKISGCVKVTSVAGSASCSWKPSNHGNILITAQAEPISSSYLKGTSTALTISTVARSTAR